MQWSILFIFCVLAPEGMNTIVFGRDRGGGQKTSACSEDISVREFYLSAITVHDTFIIILSQYIVFINACHTLYDAHLVARIPRYS